MDLGIYVSSLQDRMFLALAGLGVAFFIDTVRGVLFRQHTDPRPLLERFTDAFLSPLSVRLNRVGRADGTLVLRGVLVIAIGCVVFFGIIGWGFSFARHQGQGGLFLTLLIAFSTGTVGWFVPLRALGLALTNPKAPRPYHVLSRATYSNLITLDDPGLIRVGVTAAIRSLTIRLAAPVILFVLFGWQALALYWPVMTVSLIAGQDGASRAFAVVANGLAALLLFIPTLLIFPVVLIALLFSAGASFFRAVPGFFRVTKWPKFVQGGLPLLLVAYAMKLTLGGPRQDRNGAAVAGAWVGSEQSTAKLESRDIGRVLYFQGVVLLLTAALLYIFAVI